MGNNDIASHETVKVEQLDEPMSMMSKDQTRKVYGPTELRYVFYGREYSLAGPGEVLTQSTADVDSASVMSI